MADHKSSNRNEQRLARALQKQRGISYMQALKEVRADQAMRQIPVEYQFVAAVVEDLRRNGRAGAAEAVLRSRSADFFQDRSSLSKDSRDLVQLANHAMKYWAISGMRQIEELELCEQPDNWIPIDNLQDTVMLDRVLGEWQEALKSRAEPSPRRLPVRREGVIETLAQIQLAMRATSHLANASEWTPESLRSAATAADRFGRSLSAAFGSGIVLGIPPAVSAALAAMREPLRAGLGV